MRNSGKNVLIWVVVLVSLAFVYDFFQESLAGPTSNYKFSDFLTEVERGQVASVMIQGNHIRGKLSDGSQFFTYAPRYDNLVDKLHEQGVAVEALPNETRINSFLGLLLSWFPILLLIGVWVFFMRQMQGGGGGKALGFGKSKARLLSDKNNKTTFKDVAGIEEAKESLAEIVAFLKDPAKFSRLGAKIPKGCLLIGPPGTGKTLLARAIAGEAQVPFYSASGSDFVEMFVGVGASRVRDMFDQAKQQNVPCIIFIDEIDAVGRKRGEGFGSGGNDEREQTLNQLLTEMDGFKPNEGIVIIAATNRADVLDKALLRPGRFDRQIEVPLPDLRGRIEILKVHFRNIRTAPSVNVEMLARGTPRFSGADLANLVNEAALYAAMHPNNRMVTMEHCEKAKDKIMMGMERKSLMMSEEEKKLTAYHESGHALVSFYLAIPGADIIYKATIIPRGPALGLVMRVPEADKFSVTRENLHIDLAICMGGRIAEEMIFGYDKVTTGASSDIKQATNIAKAMVTEWGMSDKVGPIFYGDLQEFYYKSRSNSDTTDNVIDSEIKHILDTAYKLAQKVLTENIDKLHLLAEALLEYETLTGAEIKDLLEGRGIKKASSISLENPQSSFPQAGDVEETENLDEAKQS